MWENGTDDANWETVMKYYGNGTISIQFRSIRQQSGIGCVARFHYEALDGIDRT